MSETQNASDNEVVVPRTRDINGNPVYETHLTLSDDTRTKVLRVKPGLVIPIIFIPGIMGTNLKNKKTGNPVWRPPNKGLNLADILGIVTALATWGFRGPKKRQEILKAEDLTVDDSGPIAIGQSGLEKETAKMRGWGTVLRDSYSPIMALIEARMDNFLGSDGELGPWWNDQAMQSPRQFNAETDLPPLSEGEIRSAAAHHYDVWCAGYNWLQSNRNSAKDIRRYIEDTVLKHYRDHFYEVGKVILVTHSMGGLVARALVELEGYDKVLGVVHGVQPATGAPAIYHHMRAGYEGAEQLILGANAGEVTAVVANSPGALELCPSSDHRDGAPWLFLQDGHGNVIMDEAGLPCAYPRNGNPYDEIYKNPAWFGLVPVANEKYLDLSSDPETAAVSPRAKLEQLIDGVENFHNQLSGKYHPETYAHYGADDRMHSWQDIVWRGDVDVVGMSGVFHDDENGTYDPKVRHWGGKRVQRVRLTPVDGSGDGTVSVFSGAAPAQAGIKGSFRQGGRATFNEKKVQKGYDHQSSYNDSRAQWATLYGIVRIALLNGAGDS